MGREALEVDEANGDESPLKHSALVQAHAAMLALTQIAVRRAVRLDCDAWRVPVSSATPGPLPHDLATELPRAHFSLGLPADAPITRP
jgi:hypothetical protein